MLYRSDQKTETENEQGSETKAQAFGRKLGLISRLVGCSHRELSRPFVDGNTSYKSCLKCGARRQFNIETFETFGSFYYPPAVRR